MGFAKVVITGWFPVFRSANSTGRMPLESEEIPLDLSPKPRPPWGTLRLAGQYKRRGSDRLRIFGSHDGYQDDMVGGTLSTTAHFKPLVGHGGFDSSMYAYLIYRNRPIAWGLRSRPLAIVRLSPWRYEYDAAFVVAMTFENFQI